MKMKMLAAVPLAAALFWSALAAPVAAHQPLVPTAPAVAVDGWPVPVTVIPDPTAASLAVYGALTAPAQADIYVFRVGADRPDLPVEAFVPRRASLSGFYPTVALIAPGLSIEEANDLPFPVPSGYGAYIVRPVLGARQDFYEPFSGEAYWHGTELPLPVSAGQTYGIAVYDRAGQSGAYVLGVGDKEEFSGVSWSALVSAVLRLKLGLFRGVRLPVLSLWAYLLFVIGALLSLSGWIAAAAFSLRLPSGKRATAAVKNARELHWLSWTGEAIAVLGAALIFIGRGLAGTAPFLALCFFIIFAVETALVWKFSPVSAKGARLGRRGALLTLCAVFFAWFAAVFFVTWQLLVLN